MKIRKFLFYCFYIPTMVLTTLFLVFFGYLLPFSRRMKIATLWNLWNSVSVYQIITGNRVIVEGLDNIPDAPFVAVSNHHSEWETLYLGRVLQPLSIVIKKELTKIPVFGWAMIAARHIAIDRTNPRASIQQIVDQGKQRIEAGISVLIFPEATRVPVGQFKRFGRSAAKIAIDKQVPFVPIVHNAGHCWTADGKFRSGTIRVSIGEPISVFDKTSDQVTREAEHWIHTEYQRIDAA